MKSATKSLSSKNMDVELPRVISSSASLLLTFQSVHLQFLLSLTPSLQPPSVPHYPPPPPPPPPTSAHGCQSFRDAVSCEIAQIAVALRLAQQQRGGEWGRENRGGEKRIRGEGDFMLQHF